LLEKCGIFDEDVDDDDEDDDVTLLFATELPTLLPFELALTGLFTNV